MKGYNIYVSKTVKEKANAFFESHEHLVPKFKKLMGELTVDPYKGSGRPHRLMRELKNLNCWARRLDKAHRLVYVISDEARCVTISHVGEHY